MNPCDRVDCLLSAYIEREAGPAEIRFIEGHFTACPRCRQQAADVERLVRRLRFLPRPEISPDFTSRVLDQALGRAPAGLEEPLVPHPRSAAMTWAPPLAAAAALVVVAYAGLSRHDHFPAGVPAAPSSFPLVAATSGSSTAKEVPAETITVRRLDETNPSFRMEDAVQPTSLGTVSYVLEDWTLREPAGGGTPVLTRVKGDSAQAVVVTF